MKAITVLACLALAVLASATPTVHHCHGGADVTYQGIYRSDVEAFLGIPYGQDTGGENRFKRPKPYHFSKPGTTFIATKEGPACPQPKGAQLLPLYLGNITEISEDCLLLNVLRPNGTTAADRLPVMVHIHGGGFIGASKDEPAIQPEGLILQSLDNGHPVMNVEINYRLGIFGFAQSDALQDEGSTNAGIRDQRLALEWVRDNIAQFGGDPERVTIFGQSSGGLAVGLQIMAYGNSKPVPFQQAICESQALEPGITGNFTRKAMAKVWHASSCGDAGSQQSAAFIECLRGLSMPQLLHIQTRTHGDGPAQNIGDEWLPGVDGDILPQAPSELIYAGKFAQGVKTMIGWCESDTEPFVPTTVTTARDTYDFFHAYTPSMTTPNLRQLLSLYPVSDFQPNVAANLTAQFFRSARILRDILMVCQPMFYAEHITSLAHQDVYLYDQNQTILTPILDAVGLEGLGVVHTSEFAYVFGNLSHYVDVDGLPTPNFTASDHALSKRESRSWSTFAALGHPSLQGRDTLKGWEPAFAEKGQTHIFVIGGPNEGLSSEQGAGSTAAIRAQKLKERCGFLNSPEIVKQLDY